MLIAPKHFGMVVDERVAINQTMSFIALIGIETYGIN